MQLIRHRGVFVGSLSIASVLGGFGAMLLIMAATTLIARCVLAPECVGKPMTDSELQQLVRERGVALEQVRVMALGGDIDLAEGHAADLGMVSLRVAKRADRLPGAGRLVELVVYEAEDFSSEHSIILEWAPESTGDAYRSESTPLVTYIECSNGWWIVRR